MNGGLRNFLGLALFAFVTRKSIQLLLTMI